MKKKANSRTRKILSFIVILILILLLLDNAVKTAFPLKYESYVIKYSEKYGIDPYLVFAVIKVESGFKPEAVSPRNAKGLMQITDKTGKWAAEEIDIKDYSSKDLFEPETNIMIGCWYLNSLLQQFGQHEDLALAAYNGGSGNVSQWLKDANLSSDGETLDRIPFKETENYLKKVKNYYKIYKKLYYIEK